MCFLSQHPPELKIGGNWTAKHGWHPILMVRPVVMRTKKERRRISGRPPSMSLSEEGSFVSCIAAHTGNRSNFLGEAAKEKAKKGEDTHSSQELTREMQAPILALGCRSATSSPQLGGCL
jgi:hypothetical protein